MKKRYRKNQTKNSGLFVLCDYKKSLNSEFSASAVSIGTTRRTDPVRSHLGFDSLVYVVLPVFLWIKLEVSIHGLQL